MCVSSIAGDVGSAAKSYGKNLVAGAKNAKWYDYAALAANPIIGAQVIAAKAGVETVLDPGAPPAAATPEKLPPAPPDLTDATLAAVKAEESKRLTAAKGRRSTFLTGQDASSTIKGTLLGGK